MRAQMLVDWRADGDYDVIGSADVCSIVQYVQRSADRLVQLLLRAVLQKRHAPSSDKLLLLFVDVDEAHLQPCPGKHDPERQADMSTSTNDRDINAHAQPIVVAY